LVTCTTKQDGAKNELCISSFNHLKEKKKKELRDSYQSLGMHFAIWNILSINTIYNGKHAGTL